MSEWILVKDKKPELYTEVLVTVWGHDVIIPEEGEELGDAMDRIWRENRYVTMAHLAGDGWNGCDGWPMVVGPVAWMPMPKPYDSNASNTLESIENALDEVRE